MSQICYVLVWVKNQWVFYASYFNIMEKNPKIKRYFCGQSSILVLNYYTNLR